MSYIEIELVAQLNFDLVSLFGFEMEVCMSEGE